jgi:hypothetical protein
VLSDTTWRLTPRVALGRKSQSKTMGRETASHVIRETSDE